MDFLVFSLSLCFNQTDNFSLFSAQQIRVAEADTDNYCCTGKIKFTLNYICYEVVAVDLLSALR